MEIGERSRGACADRVRTQTTITGAEETAVDLFPEHPSRVVLVSQPSAPALAA
jgi:hypothetical protein